MSNCIGMFHLALIVEYLCMAGYERSTPMTRLYYREAASCIIKFDVTNPSTFHNCLIWKWDMDNGAMLLDGRPVPCILLANKVSPGFALLLGSWEIGQKMTT
ncbi:RAB7L protein, partial [Amia calva]|nr:RAB7L protein [Amia calva]